MFGPINYGPPVIVITHGPSSHKGVKQAQTIRESSTQLFAITNQN